MDQPATIPDGIYKAVITTSGDTVVESVCMVKDSKFTGADFINSYTGQFTYDSGVPRAWMRRKRHGPDILAKLKLPMEMDIIWKVRIEENGFVLDTTYPVHNLRVIATFERIG